MGKWSEQITLPDILSLKAFPAEDGDIRRVETVSETYVYPPAYFVFELGATYTEASPAIIEDDLATGFWVMFPSPFILSAGNPTVDADLAGITWINTTTGDRYISNSDLSWTAIATGASSTVETTTAYTQPSELSNVTINATSSENFAIGQFIFIEVGGNYEVVSKPSPTQLEILNTGDTGNALPATEILTGSLIVPSGRPGDFAGLVDPMTTVGDIIVRDAGNATTRLAIGTEGQVLTVTTGVPAWEDPTGGGGGGLTTVNALGTLTTGSHAIDWSFGGTTATNNGTVTYTFSNIGTDKREHTVLFTLTSGTPTFPTLIWIGGVVPSVTGKTYEIQFFTYDGGTTVYAGFSQLGA